MSLKIYKSTLSYQLLSFPRLTMKPEGRQIKFLTMYPHRHVIATTASLLFIGGLMSIFVAPVVVASSNNNPLIILIAVGCGGACLFGGIFLTAVCNRLYAMDKIFEDRSDVAISYSPSPHLSPNDDPEMPISATERSLLEYTTEQASSSVISQCQLNTHYGATQGEV